MPRFARIAALALMLALAVPAAAKSVEIEWIADVRLSELLKKPAYQQVWRSQILSEIPAEDQVWIEDALSSSGPNGEIKDKRPTLSRFHPAPSARRRQALYPNQRATCRSGTRAVSRTAPDAGTQRT